MPDIQTLVDLIRQRAFLEAGGGRRDPSESIGQIFGNVGSGMSKFSEARNKNLESILLGEKEAREGEKFNQEFSKQPIAEGSPTSLYQKTALSTIKKNERERQPLSTRSALDSNFARADELQTLFPDIQFDDLGQIPVSEVQARRSMERAKTIGGETADRQEKNQQRAAEIKEAGENRAKYKADLDAIQSIKDNLIASKDVLKNITPGIMGAGQSLVAKTGLAYPEAATYDRTKNALAVSLYRAMTGDTRLSDADAAARALPLLPSTNQDEPQREQLWKFVDDAIGRREQFLQQGIKEIPWDSVVQKDGQPTEPPTTNIVNPQKLSPPRIGERQGNYRFKGGDPKVQSNWVPVKK